jgi:hypothetical protein
MQAFDLKFFIGFFSRSEMTKDLTPVSESLWFEPKASPESSIQSRQDLGLPKARIQDDLTDCQLARERLCLPAAGVSTCKLLQCCGMRQR